MDRERLFRYCMIVVFGAIIILACDLVSRCTFIFPRPIKPVTSRSRS
jgi:hypothetical protein